LHQYPRLLEFDNTQNAAGTFRAHTAFYVCSLFSRYHLAARNAACIFHPNGSSRKRGIAIKSQTILLGMLIMILSGGPVGAEMYQWVDDNGVNRFSNMPPPEEVEDYEARTEIAYDEAADLARTANDSRAVDEYSQMKAQQEQLQKQMEEAKARQAEAERIAAIKEEQEKIAEGLSKKTRWIRTRARRRYYRLRNIEKELATLEATPENAKRRADLEAEKQVVIEGLMQNERYFQRGGRQLVQEYNELEKQLQEYK